MLTSIGGDAINEIKQIESYIEGTTKAEFLDKDGLYGCCN